MSLVPTKGRPIVSSDAKEKLKNTGNRIKDVIGSSASSAKGVLDAEFNRTRADRVEKVHEFSVMWRSFFIIVVSSAAFFLVGFFFKGEWTYKDFFYNMGCNILAMFIVVTLKIGRASCRERV